MDRREKVTIIILNSIIAIISVLGLTFILPNLEWYMKVLAYGAVVIFSVATFVFLFIKYFKLAKSSFTLNVFTFVILLIFFVLNLCGLFENLSDMEHIKNLILSSGEWGIIICFLIQLLQVVVLPAPGWVFYLATAAIYGSGVGFLICYTSTVLGSFIAFLIGKGFGRKAVEWCIGKEDTEKYSTLLNKKGKVPFIMMQLLPFFPDDILCMVAGLSSMTYRFFITTIILVKPIYIAVVCFLGTGYLIPFSGWGIPVWIGIFAVFLLIGLLYFKNQDKIDNWLRNKFTKGKENKNV